jgi:hypothetical protein
MLVPYPQKDRYYPQYHITGGHVNVVKASSAQLRQLMLVNRTVEGCLTAL